MSYRIRRKLLWTLFLLVLVVLAGVAASATTLVRMNFEELAQQATAITRARCLGSTSVWRNGEIWTETEFGRKGGEKIGPEESALSSPAARSRPRRSKLKSACDFNIQPLPPWFTKGGDSRG